MASIIWTLVPIRRESVKMLMPAARLAALLALGDLDVRALTGVYKNMRRGIVALVFRCDVVEGQPRTTSEAREFAWIEPGQLRSRMTEAYSIRLLDALHKEAAPTVRAHDGRSLVI